MLNGDQIIAHLSSLSEVMNDEETTNEFAGHQQHQSRASFQMIKEHVQEIYDVAPSPISDDVVDDE